MRKVSVSPKNDYVTIIEELVDNGRKIVMAHDICIDDNLVGTVSRCGPKTIHVSSGDKVMFDRIRSAKMKNISGDGEFYITREKNIKLKVC